MRIIGLSRLEELLIEFLGEPKTRYYDEIEGQRIFNCPRCTAENNGVPDGKYNLEISFEKRFDQGGVFQCWRCRASEEDMKGNVLKLIKKYGNKSIYDEFLRILREIYQSRMYDLSLYSSSETANPMVFLTLPSTYTKIVNLEKCKKDVREYLKSRGITQEIIDKHHIGYTTWDEPDYRYKNRIIIPSYDTEGNLNYWVGRDYTGKAVNKYCNCPGVKKTDIVFQESLLCFDADIYLVEGALDCIYGNNCTSLLGKQLDEDNALARTLKERANANIIICLDGDTAYGEMKKIYDILGKGRLKNKIRYINMAETDFKDFGEAFEYGGRKTIIELLKSQKEAEKKEILKY